MNVEKLTDTGPLPERHQGAERALDEGRLLLHREHSLQLQGTIIRHDPMETEKAIKTQGDVQSMGAWKSLGFNSQPFCGVKSQSKPGTVPQSPGKLRLFYSNKMS